MGGLIIIAASPWSQPASSPLYCHLTDTPSRGSCSEKLPWCFFNNYLHRHFYTGDGCSWCIRWQHRTESTPASCSGCCTPSTDLTIFQDPISGWITVSMSEIWWCSSCHSSLRLCPLQKERPITLSMKHLLVSTGGQIVGRPVPLATTSSELGLNSFYRWCCKHLHPADLPAAILIRHRPRELVWFGWCSYTAAGMYCRKQCEWEKS